MNLVMCRHPQVGTKGANVQLLPLQDLSRLQIRQRWNTYAHCRNADLSIKHAFNLKQQHLFLCDQEGETFDCLKSRSENKIPLQMNYVLTWSSESRPRYDASTKFPFFLVAIKIPLQCFTNGLSSYDIRLYSEK
ncbi:hypothetical protein L2E82_05331 [Cichorium intybus]|uniref:Uncharacterized protein n=1 Tax=Cichorium intybus TaxID=13427 RepID=A0ACB9H7W4_CICIN|nr:hypothetical protein L2E82_05331 [Cichorium intybus]